MAEFVTLSCPSCGGKLEITPDVERFACGYCGQEHVVKRGGGIVSLAPVVDALNKVGAGVDKTAAELAIVRVKHEIDGLYANRQALLQGNPRPATHPISILFVAGGLLFAGAGVILMLLPHDMSGIGPGAACAGIGLVMALFGWLDLGAVGPATNRWDRTMGVQLKSLDEQVAMKQAELQRLQAVVSN